MDIRTILASIAVCLFGSGGIVIWFLNRWAGRTDRLDDISELLKTLQDGLVMTLENDRVIFKALRSHEINGESEEQERKMDRYFISLLQDNGERKK